jgi:hypothetical protein
MSPPHLITVDLRRSPNDLRLRYPLPSSDQEDLFGISDLEDLISG